MALDAKRQPPEFRKDLVSGDWILIAPQRRKRPEFFQEKPKKSAKSVRQAKDIEICPFEDPQKSGNPFPILWYPRPKTPREKKNDLSSWFVQVIPNKYPLLSLPLNPKHPSVKFLGPQQILKGIGFHEVIITRDHFKTIDKMTIEEAELLLHVYQKRYQTLANEPSVHYILIFHNQGRLAGASLPHPHSQLIAIPVVDLDLSGSLTGSQEYHKQYGRCLHCVLLEWDLKQDQRIIYQNEHFVTLTPFTPKVSYETRIYPVGHNAHFDTISDEERLSLADSLRDALRRIAQALGNPDYNFFIHSAPPATEEYNDSYHWHLEIMPRVSGWAGLELGAGIEVVVVSPEEAAENLRKAD